MQDRTIDTQNQYVYAGGTQKRRRKTDWAGIGPGDAFKPSLDYHLRLAAQSRFYKLVRKVQLAAARQAGHASEAFDGKAKPQLSPIYTSYPAAIAAYAAAGLTGYLEYEARVPGMILTASLEHYLEDPAKRDKANVDPAVYRKLALIVAERVQARLLLEDLSRVSAMSSVELYRLFSASQEDASYRSIPSILSAVILYGDVLPSCEGGNLHHTTRALHGDILSASRPFITKLARTTSAGGMLTLGRSWVRAVCRCLLPYLPPPEPQSNKATPPERRHHERLRAMMRQHELSVGFGDSDLPSPDQRIPPLHEPSPPALFDPPGPAQRLAHALGAAARDFAGGKAGTPQPEPVPKPVDEAVQQLLAEFEMALHQAGGQHNDYEDMRSDILEKVLRGAGFRSSPIEGSPVGGNEVTVWLGNDAVGGEIFDRPVDLSHDTAAHDRLISEAQPITDALRRTLYPNVREVPKTEYLRTSGALDPARLSLAEVSLAVFRRYRMEERADRRGRPVILIACDGSGSLSSAQMRMTKVLAAAWLSSMARSEVQVMAGLYHSGTVRNGVSGPLVQWMYHPRKTPAISLKDATRALVTLPDNGTGVQADALSLAYMVEEARRIARGRMIYLILVSDCEWNRCLKTEKSGEEEVRAFFESTYERSRDNLHTTLVALGGKVESGLEDVLDKVIVVPDEKLTDYVAVAGQIGVYVASCMRERRELVNRR